MKKILLVTLQGANYGNRLQNYALQKTLEEMGFEVWTPYYDIPERDTLYKKFRYYVKAVLYQFGFKRFQYEYTHLVKEKAFGEFNKKYIINMFKISFKRAFSKKWDEYEYAITGSDQVWHNWSSNKYELRYFYLQFIEKKKRIAYAASFGFRTFPQNDLNSHKKGLCGMDKISCREDEAASLIKSVTDMAPVVVCDPTLLLNKEQWSEIARCPKYLDERKYVVKYFLGRISDKDSRIIEEYAKKNKYRIIDIIKPEDLELYKTKPDEFLWLISHAEYIFTDSYHATVISMIFNKQFMIFKRVGTGYENMFGRLETIINRYGLLENVFEGEVKNIKHDYNVIYEKIQQDNSISKKFLQDCLDK